MTRLPTGVASTVRGLGEGGDDFQSVLADAFGVRGLGDRQDGAAVPQSDLQRGADDPQVQDSRTRGVFAGVGDQFADDQLDDLHRVGHDPYAVGVSELVQEGHRVVAGVCDAGAVAVECERDFRQCWNDWLPTADVFR
ncbi:hypothetical protein ACFWJM_25185 [Streptomyces sp. NPDC127077]|uniref:hypothetical protein n=1 Tax=Streptomyces sp. NPDC127077 TaxID=3347131 RepID=UPI0036612C13